jgi:hypothetical protein
VRNSEHPLRTSGCAARERGRPASPSTRSLNLASRPLGVDPLQSSTSSRPTDPLGPAPTPTRFFAPSTTSPGLAPSAADRPASVAVPPSGFLNLSAVSWHARASRPCFVPQPPVGFSLQSLTLRQGRVRLSASPCSLAVLHRASSPRARPRPCHSGFHRLPCRVARWPDSPPELGASFQPRVRVRPHRHPRRPGPRTPTSAHRDVTSFVCFGASLPPRSRTAASAKRRSAAVALLGFAPPEPSSDRASGPVWPGGPFRPPRASIRDGEEGYSPPSGETARPRGRPVLVGARPAVRLRTGTCRLSTATLPPSTFERPTVIGRPGSSEV